MTWKLAIPCLAISLVFGAGTAFGQGGGGGSSGVSTITPSGGGSAGNSAQGAASTLFGGSSTGASRSGQTGSAASGGLAQPQFTQFGQAGTGIGSGFVGRGNNTQTFVGAQGAGQQTIDAGGTPQFGGLGGQRGGGRGATSTAQARGGQMRIPQRIAFTVPAEFAPRPQVSLQGTLASLPGAPAGVSVSIREPGHLVLQGRVASDHDRRLVEALARLEPGVRVVTNDLEVGPGPSLPVLP